MKTYTILKNDILNDKVYLDLRNNIEFYKDSYEVKRIYYNGELYARYQTVIESIDNGKYKFINIPIKAAKASPDKWKEVDEFFIKIDNYNLAIFTLYEVTVDDGEKIYVFVN